MESDFVSNIVNALKAIFLFLLIALQVFLIGFSFAKFHEIATYFYLAFQLVSYGFLAYIIAGNSKASFKLSWSIFLLVVPTAGIFFYILFGKTRFIKDITKNEREVIKENNFIFEQNKEILDSIEDTDAVAQIDLIYNLSGFPVYNNTELDYCNIGEVFLEKLLIELKKAEKFIFMEYFIVAEGAMHREIFEVLCEKAKSGVEVFYMYDCAGSSMVTPKNFLKDCKKNGIKGIAFNSSVAHIYSFASYRDHRKITVVDGNVGFMGGVNIGDEYINVTHKLGHWKDMAIRLEGDGVWSLSVLFMTTWMVMTKEKLDTDKYRPTVSKPCESIIVPFGDGPTNPKDPAENNYIKMITTAKKYVYITTPYLIIDNDMVTALSIAAKSGVDVRILTPHVPDNKIIFNITQSFYSELTSNGVKIFEYTPGFVHGKTLVSDDKFGIVGSINFDFRSLIWNFECGTWYFDEKLASIMKKDYLSTLEVSQEMTYSKVQDFRVIKKMYQAFLRICSPLC